MKVGALVSARESNEQSVPTDFSTKMADMQLIRRFRSTPHMHGNQTVSFRAPPVWLSCADDGH